MGWSVEGFAAKTLRWLVGIANGKQEFALRGELADGMIAIIRTVDRAVGADVNSVGASAEQPLTPRPQKIPLAVEDDNRMLAARNEINVILRVDVNSRHLDIPPAIRQLSPTFGRCIGVLSASQECTCHGISFLACSLETFPLPANAVTDHDRAQLATETGCSIERFRK